MLETHLNLFDAVVIAVMILSCMFAFFRGFVREMLSLGAWIGAALVTFYYFPDVAEKLKPHFKSPIGAAGVGTLIIYTGALIGFSMVNALIMKFVKSGNEVGMLDNFMGLLFGAARGALIVSLGYFLLTIAMPEKEYPDWLKQSVMRPYVEKGAIKLAEVAPEYLREISTLEKKATAEMQGNHPSPLSDDDVTIDKKPQEDVGYNRTSTTQMDRLLDSTKK